MDDEAGTPTFDARVYADGVAFDASDAALLDAVESEGSLNAAADSLERSYSRAHKRLTALEETFGPLVDRQRGGSSGGGSTLTDRGRAVRTRFERLRAEFSGVAGTETTVLSGTVRERDGALGVVETDAGELRALVPADTDDVQVTIRADAVTLQAADSAPMASETSARNRVRGTVESVTERDGLVTVAVDVGADRPLTAVVTPRSRNVLELAPGREVLASVKATTTRAVPDRRDGR
jgi:molybdate transport system regulatory protein